MKTSLFPNISARETAKRAREIQKEMEQSECHHYQYRKYKESDIKGEIGINLRRLLPQSRIFIFFYCIDLIDIHGDT